MTNLSQERIRAVIVHPAVAGRLMLGRARLLDIPNDAELVQVYYEPLRRAFLLLFAHSSFDPVPIGELAPVSMACIEERDDWVLR